MMWGFGPYGMMGYGGGWAMGPMMLFGGLFWVLLLVLVVMFVARPMRGRWHGYDDRPRRPAALDILEERYARGEINRDEYLQKKGDILGRSAS